MNIFFKFFKVVVICFCVIILISCTIDGASSTSVNHPDAFTLSSDSLVFDHKEVSESYQIFSMTKDGQNPKAITNFPGYNCWWPRISPDRTKILFYRTAVANNEDYSKAELCLINADGSGFRVLRSAGVFQAHAEWSPDGTRLVMILGVLSGGNTVLQIVVTSADGILDHQVTNSPVGQRNSDPSWSPDGYWIVYNHSDAPSTSVANCPFSTTRTLELYKIPAATILENTLPTRLTTDAAGDSGLEDDDPYYSPDGTKIVWIRCDNYSAWNGAGIWSIRIMNNDGTGIKNIISDNNLNSRATWSSDGSLLYFHRMAPLATPSLTNWRLFSIRADGNSLTSIDPFNTGDSEYISH